MNILLLADYAFDGTYDVSGTSTELIIRQGADGLYQTRSQSGRTNRPGSSACDTETETGEVETRSMISIEGTANDWNQSRSGSSLTEQYVLFGESSAFIPGQNI